MTDLQNYMDTQVKIFLRNKISYSGIITNISSSFIEILDKYDVPVAIARKEIVSIQKIEEDRRILK